MIRLPQILKPIHKNDLIRIGSKHDGGYVLTKELIFNSDFLLSFGLSFNWEFEEDFNEKKGNCPIHIYDHTVEKCAFLYFTARSLLAIIHNPFKRNNWKNFLKYFSYRSFFNNPSIVHFQERVWHENRNGVTIDDIFKKIPSDKIFLKMDIEGSEYRVIEKLLENQKRLVGMTVEFHDVDILYPVWMDIIGKIKKYFHIVHIHANNIGDIGTNNLPLVWEITFEKKTFTKNPASSQYSYPVEGADSPNDPKKTDYSFSFI